MGSCGSGELTETTLVYCIDVVSSATLIAANFRPKNRYHPAGSLCTCMYLRGGYKGPHQCQISMRQPCGFKYIDLVVGTSLVTSRRPRVRVSEATSLYSHARAIIYSVANVLRNSDSRYRVSALRDAYAVPSAYLSLI